VFSEFKVVSNLHGEDWWSGPIQDDIDNIGLADTFDGFLPQLREYGHLLGDADQGDLFLRCQHHRSSPLDAGIPRILPLAPGCPSVGLGSGRR